MQHPSFEVVTCMMSIIIGTANPFLFCYLGKLATESFENMAYCVYSSNWHQLDVNLKKCAVLMITIGQRPLIYHGYGMLTLNLETFTQVMAHFFEISKVFGLGNKNYVNFLYFLVDENDFHLLLVVENINKLERIG